MTHFGYAKSTNICIPLFLSPHTGYMVTVRAAYQKSRRICRFLRRTCTCKKSCQVAFPVICNLFKIGVKEKEVRVGPLLTGPRRQWLRSRGKIRKISVSMCSGPEQFRFAVHACDTQDSVKWEMRDHEHESIPVELQSLVASRVLPGLTPATRTRNLQGCSVVCGAVYVFAKISLCCTYHNAHPHT